MVLQSGWISAAHDWLVGGEGRGQWAGPAGPAGLTLSSSGIVLHVFLNLITEILLISQVMLSSIYIQRVIEVQ